MSSRRDFLNIAAGATTSFLLAGPDRADACGLRRLLERLRRRRQQRLGFGVTFDETVTIDYPEDERFGCTGLNFYHVDKSNGGIYCCGLIPSTTTEVWGKIYPGHVTDAKSLPGDAVQADCFSTTTTIFLFKPKTLFGANHNEMGTEENTVYVWAKLPTKTIYSFARFCARSSDTPDNPCAMNCDMTMPPIEPADLFSLKPSTVKVGSRETLTIVGKNFRPQSYVMFDKKLIAKALFEGPQRLQLKLDPQITEKAGRYLIRVHSHTGKVTRTLPLKVVK